MATVLEVQVNVHTKAVTTVDEEFPISVRTTDGKNIRLMVLSSDTVEKLKQKIQAKEKIPSDRQRIFFSGKELEDNRTLSEYSIQAGTTVHLVGPPVQLGTFLIISLDLNTLIFRPVCRHIHLNKHS